ncbi:MAG: O-antigen ligase family protein, partial [Sciscionella sp.]
ALGGAGRLALNIILVPIAYGAARERRHVTWLVGAFVVGAVISGTYGLVLSSSGGIDAGRLTGTLGESNAEGTVLAAAIPLLIALYIVIRHSARLKLAALIGVALLFAGLVGTLSREGLVSLGAVLVGAVVFGGRWRRHAVVLLVVGVTATVGYYAVLAPPSSVQRVTMTDTSGRSSLWTVAWRVIQAHPLLGVGNGNFVQVSRRYINQPGQIEAYYIVSQPKVAHNTFLEAAADLGIPGLLMLLAVLWFLLSAAVRAAWTFERLGDGPMELIARGVFLAVLAVLASDMFVSGDYAKYQWLLFGLCPVLLAAARREEAGRPAQPYASAHV